MKMGQGFLNLTELGDFTAAAVENDTVSFIAAHHDGSVFTCNRAFCRLTGYSREEISKMRWPEDFTAAEHRARAVEIIKGTDIDASSCPYELALTRKDGSRVPVVLYEHKFIDGTGTPQYYYSFITDMTEYKRLENVIRTSEAKYRELVENANSIILKLDTHGKIIFFNEFAQQYFRYHPGEILGKNVIGTIVPIAESSGRDLSKLINEICNHPERYINNENENMRSNGERVWVSWTNKAITDDRGNPAGILCVGNDITALKNAETELKRARDELEVRVRERTAELEQVNKFLLNEIEARKQAEKGLMESEEKFRTLVETSPIPIILHRKEDIIYANPAAVEWSGYSAEEIQKMKFWELVLPQFQKLEKERVLAKLQGENQLSINELKLQTNKGEKWVKISSARLMYKGSPAILAMIEDITSYKQAMTALHDSKEEAELYVDLMSHDISNINQAGMGNLELLQDNVKLDVQGQERLSTALQAFEKSSELIKNVKKLQKVKKGDLQYEKIDISQVLDKVRTDYQTFPGRDITIHLKSDGGCFVYADTLLYDVFSNIVDNSIKHSSGPVHINIGLSVEEINDKKFYRVSIEDNGPGIKPDLKKRILNRVLYVDGIMSGKGLGLYLVKTLVDSFHGSIAIEDRIPGDYAKGARFVIVLPAVKI
jgi:PAS domain S-box-containing protein